MSAYYYYYYYNITYHEIIYGPQAVALHPASAQARLLGSPSQAGQVYAQQRVIARHLTVNVAGIRARPSPERGPPGCDVH